MHERLNEIRSFLEHSDYQVAIRRILDLSLDTSNRSLIAESINWSRRFKQHLAKNDEQKINESVQEVDPLITRLSAAISSSAFEKKKVLQATDISKSYLSGHFRLHPMNVEVNTGDVIGVVGENGNGKTTLLRCLGRQLSLDTGTLSYSFPGIQDDYNIRHHVAFIPQRIPRWYGKLKDNLHFSAAIAGIPANENSLMVDFMLERMNLAEYAELNWDQISSGYRTRFEIARVLLQRPKLMLLDEPLANLDILAQQTLLSDLRYLAKSYRHPIGVVLSSQQLHEVEKAADYVLFLKKGECLFKSNSTEEVKTFVVEVETTADRNTILSIFDDSGITVHFNGSYYTFSSSSVSAEEIIDKLRTHSIPMTYFRDISHSTKRFF